MGDCDLSSASFVECMSEKELMADGVWLRTEPESYEL
jgi:hypothetical protein